MAQKGSAAHRFVLITGLSGAGKTQALRAFEDMGYFAVDNIPPELIPKLLELVRQGGSEKRAALVVDCRQDVLFGGIAAALDLLKRLGVPFEVLYLESDEAALVRRYKETRRAHPLAPGGSVIEGIRREEKELSPIRREATYVVDTTPLSPHQLKDRLESLFGRDHDRGPRVTLESFGFKFGTPPDADVVLDVRGLPNPYYDNDLAPLPGTDSRIVAYVQDSEAARGLLADMERLLADYLAHLPGEGRETFVIAVGCTGGRHRSVAVVEILAQRLLGRFPDLRVAHRDLGREESPSATS